MRRERAPEWRDIPGREWRSVSELKLRVSVEPVTFTDGSSKIWERVEVLTRDASFLPSFEDLYRIIRPICQLEDDKYPNGEGRDMVRRFLAACCRREPTTYPELEAEFELPHRTSSDEKRWLEKQRAAEHARDLEEMRDTWDDVDENAGRRPEDLDSESSEPIDDPLAGIKWE